ncbi:MAG: hypothetical protein AB7S69_17920 [Salinivirgaceae bacterium]
MRKLTLTHLMVFLIIMVANAQKLTPDVDLVSEIISQKQEELKQRVLKNIVVNNIKTTNYTTYNTTYHLVEILTTEKNKTVMTQNLISEISDYAITYSLADYFIKNELNIEGLQNKSFGDSKGLYELMTINLENEQRDKFTKQIVIKESETQIPVGLLTNYIIDTLNTILANSTFFKNKGFFQENPKSKKFKFGLDLDYSAIESSGKATKIVSQLNTFVLKINTSLNSTDEVFKFINSSGKNINDLKTLNNDDIGFIFQLFSLSLDKFRNEVGQNSFIAKIGDIISTYVIYDMVQDDPDKVYSFKLDVEAIILSLEDEFYNNKITGLKKHKVGIEPFFGIGINYGILTSDNNVILNEANTGSIYQIAYVSEKFGFKFLFADFEYTRSHKPLEWFKYRGTYRRWKGPVKDPLINNVYGMIYASGILYNVVDLKSEDNYNFAMLGTGLGLTFFNELEMNISYSIPLIKNENPFENGMVNLGFDIPIFEYIKASRNKAK